MSTDDNTLNSLADKVTVILIGIGSAVLVVTIYHFIVTGWCDRNDVATRENIEENAGDQSFVTDNNSAAHLIPAFKYQKGMGLGVDDEETCVICLSEFEEGEELKRLPECMHSFHVSCIDMWLFSHSSCPVCRSDAVSPQIWRTNGDGDVENGEGALRNIVMYTDPGMLQNVVIHSMRL